MIHAQRADKRGNVQFWGIVGVQKEAVLSARRSLVTVEELVDELDPVPGATVLPAWSVTAVAHAPGAPATYAEGYHVRDNQFFVDWDPISRDRDQFAAWMEENIMRLPRSR